MGTVMLGTEVAKAMKERLIQRAEAMKEKGVMPKLAILRVGARPDDLSYERGAKKRMELTGMASQVVELPEDVSQKKLEETLEALNRDTSVHGILVIRPLPGHLDEEPLKQMIDPVKDVDCKSLVCRDVGGDEAAAGAESRPCRQQGGSGHAPLACDQQGMTEMPFMGIPLPPRKHRTDHLPIDPLS